MTVVGAVGEGFAIGALYFCFVLWLAENIAIYLISWLKDVRHSSAKV